MDRVRGAWLMSVMMPASPLWQQMREEVAAVADRFEWSADADPLGLGRVAQDEPAFYVDPGKDHCGRCRDINYDAHTRVCLTCTYPEMCGCELPPPTIVVDANGYLSWCGRCGGRRG